MNFDINQLNVYSGSLKTFRLYFLAQQAPQLIPQIIPKLEQDGLYMAVQSLVQQSSKQQYQKEELQAIQRVINEKRNLCTQAKNQQNRIALKQLNVELGNIYLQAGDLVEAYNCYFKAHENNTTQEALDYAISWMFCMIMTNNFMHYKVINVIPKDKDQQYQKWLLMSAIRNFSKLDYQSFLREILTIDNQFLPSVDFITCYQDLSKYFVITCLIIKLPKDIVEMLQHPFIVQILDADPKVIEILNCYIDYDFVQLIQKAQEIINELNRDLISKKLLGQIKEKVIMTLLKQYIINFKRMSLLSLAKLLNQSEDHTLAQVERMIKTENLHYIVDPIEFIVVEKYTHEEQKLSQNRKLSQTVLKAIDQKYISALKESIK